MFDRQFWNSKKVLITGNTGFKGSWTHFALKQMGAKVYGYSLAPEPHQKLFSLLDLHQDDRTLFADIRDAASFTKYAKAIQPEIILHMAAQPLVRRSYSEPVYTFETNIMGTVNVLQAAREVESLRSVVVITTDKVYLNEEKNKSFVEADLLGGKDPYSASKACAEIVAYSMAKSFFHDGKSKALIATTRAGNVIGGGDWSVDRLIPDVINSMIENRPVVIRNPQAIRPWQHVLEPAFGYLRIAQALYEGKTNIAKAWNFGPEDSDAKNVDHVVKRLNAIWGTNTGYVLDAGSNPEEAQYLRLNISAIKSELKWQPLMNLEQALTETVNWYKCYHQTPDQILDLSKKQVENFLKGIS